ncbi:hypothetical protein [Pseudoclavibacter sp. RFBB5]|uniref:hypothetical protein n=1 Tax=Pseudoclavibacter sp. RFBB5 TaxID=2080574 RepID=UPI000CE7391E|nr:hypothetical protein [Pseudoclavibacter sp. RFBB5]PPG27023.1 hypothetical protein C5B97_16435 [Pseudoclavibacter sp. RFBB5]
MSEPEEMLSGVGNEPFAFRDGLRAGLTRQELNGPEFSKPHRGVRVRGAVRSPLEIARAFVPRIKDRCVLGGLTAARIWGLPVPRRLDRDSTVYLLVPAGRNRPAGLGVKSRSIRASLWDARELRGAPVASPALTWATCARHLDVNELVVLGDALVATSTNYEGIVRPEEPPEGARTAPPLATLEDLEEIARTWGNGVGGASLRAAVARVRAGVESPMETWTRLVIVAGGLPEPEVGVEVWNGSEFVGRVDLAYRAQKIAIEYEGDHHRTDKRQWRKDIGRVNRLQEIDWFAIRATTSQLWPTPTRFVEQVRAALSRATDGGGP